MNHERPGTRTVWLSLLFALGVAPLACSDEEDLRTKCLRLEGKSLRAFADEQPEPRPPDSLAGLEQDFRDLEALMAKCNELERGE